MTNQPLEDRKDGQSRAPYADIILLGAAVLTPILGCGPNKGNVAKANGDGASRSSYDLRGEHFQVTGGTAKTADLSAEEYENDPGLRQRCDSLISAVKTNNPADQEFVAALARAEVLLELFSGLSDLQVHTKPGLRAATSQALILASEQAAHYYNRNNVDGQQIPQPFRTLPLELMSTGNHLLQEHPASDFSFSFAPGNDGRPLVADLAPTYKAAKTILVQQESIRKCLKELSERSPALSDLNNFSR